MKRDFLTYIALGLALTSAAQTAGRRKAAPKPRLYVSGIIKDATSKQPLQGVSVKCGLFEAITDENGHYRVGALSESAVLTLEKDGFAQRNLSMRGDTLLNTSLYSDAFNDKMSPKTFSKATNEVSLEDVLATHLGNSVRSVQRSAVAGMGANLFVRGYNSLQANVQPLLVVDGVIWDEQTLTGSLFEGSSFNTLADIDVNDIENVQILKNASAIYGSKGANGAILITTKQSHSRVTKIDADVSYGFNLKPQTYRVMDSKDYRSYLSEIIKGNSGFSHLNTEFSGILGMSPSSSDYKTYHNDNDWSKDVYRVGNTMHYGISVDGSDDIAKYAIMAGYTSSDGTVKSTDFSRLNARINAGVSLLKNFQIDTNIYFTYILRNQQDDGVSANTSPTFLSEIKSPFLLPYSYTDDGSQLTNTLNDVDVLGVSNPVAIIQNAKNSNKHYRFGLSIAPRWNINRDFSLDGRFSYSFSSTKEHYFQPMNGLSPQYDHGNKWLNTIKDMTLKQNNIYGDVHLNYHHTVGASQWHAMAGYRLMKSSFKSSYAEGHNSGNDKIINLNNSLAFRRLDGENTDWGSMALMGQVDYTYDNRYNVWAVVTTDASSRFGEYAKNSYRMLGGTWATFPSFGATWNLDNEHFMRSLRLVNDAKLHVAYGLTGNDDLEVLQRYAYLQGVGYMGNATGLKIGTLANDKLKWETVKKFNIGVELSLLNDRIGLSFDYFNHTTNDLLTYKQADITSGLSTYLCNDGKLSNRGFEVGIQGRIVALKNFSWLSSLDFQHTTNRIKQLADGDYTTEVLGGEVLTAVGHPASVFYGYKTKGVFATSAEAAEANLKIQNANASYSTFGAGDVHFVDVDGNGVINEKDKQVIGNPNPDLTGSFLNRFAYKRFQLDVLCTYSIGNDVYNYMRQQLESMQGLWNQTQAVKNRWKSEGQETTMPRAVYGDPMGNSRFSDRWIEDGSFFKVKNVKLSYELPINNTYIHGLTIWGAMSNLVTFTKYLGIDPEVSMNSKVLYQGIDNGLLANGRSFYMGMKINL